MPSTDGNAKQLEYIAAEHANWYRHQGKQLAVSYKGEHILAI